MSTPIPGFTPETDLERRLARDPVLQEGWAWGEPRRGHPEGSVGAHVADLLPTVVIVRADRRASYGAVRRALVAAQQRGFAHFSLVVLRSVER